MRSDNGGTVEKERDYRENMCVLREKKKEKKINQLANLQ